MPTDISWDETCDRCGRQARIVLNDKPYCMACYRVKTAELNGVLRVLLGKLHETASGTVPKC